MEVGTVVNEKTKYAYLIYKITKRYFYGRFVNYPKVEAKGVSKKDLEVNLEDSLKDFLY